MTRGSLLGLVLVGLGVFRHFGVTWDEPAMHRFGRQMLAFVATGDRAWEGFRQFYGPVFAVPLAAIDRISDSEALGYQLGHLFGYLVFLLAVMAMYGLCRRQYGSWGWGILGAAFLVASPRVFSHAFVNPKDGPIMSLGVVAFFFLVRFIESRRIRWIVASGVVSGLAMSIRMNAIYIVGLTGLALLGDLLGPLGRRATKRLVFTGGIYASIVVLVSILTWPLLWSDPIGNAAAAFRTMSHYIAGPQTVLYNGSVISVRSLPWHYIPWWIAITTPIPYLLLALVGLFSVPVRRAARAIREGSTDRLLILYAVWLVVPIVWMVATHAVLYDEWRQLLFVYPPLVVFAVGGAKRIWELLRVSVIRLPLQKMWAALLVGVLAWVSFRMALLHPYEALYFNSLVGGAGGAEGRYELDYWGLSYKEGLSYLLRRTDGDVRVVVCLEPGLFGPLLFRRREASRLEYVYPGADYALCAPRQTTRPFLSRSPTVYTVKRDGATLLYVKDVSPQATQSR